jgi:CxxC motif-containing protein (DUF1111 family)
MPMMRRELMKTLLTGLMLTVIALAQTDPGPRGPQPGPPQSGQPMRGLSGADLQAFNAGRASFGEIDDVRDGLGPRFNLDSCAGCHSQPAPGGTSPRVNPQLAVAAKFGAVNQAPAFLQQNGPVRVVRFKRDANGNPDGGVHDLFVISGRSDAPSGCQIAQPNFSNQNNLSFRIPTPVFGVGLIEAIADVTLKANLAANSPKKQALGIRGHFNTSAADGTITRFGWKAQNKSMEQFTGEAYNVEMGVTTNLFPNEREDDPACAVNTLPEDTADVESVATFMRLLAPPAPSPANESTTNGQTLFASVGCAACHTPSLNGAKGQADLYSDLALHHMGQALDDGITQGQAQGQDWRTAPLWGLGDRLFLLHDGRTADLLQAIRLHDSPGSEAHQVVVNFQALTADQKQDILNFLRSL